MNVRNFIFPLRNEQDAIASTVTPVTFDRLQISYGSMCRNRRPLMLKPMIVVLAFAVLAASPWPQVISGKKG
jgi:hypothetical protein